MIIDKELVEIVLNKYLNNLNITVTHLSVEKWAVIGNDIMVVYNIRTDEENSCGYDAGITIPMCFYLKIIRDIRINILLNDL